MIILHLKGYPGRVSFFYPLAWHGGPDGEGGMLTDIMISVLKLSIDEKSIKAVFVSISAKKRKSSCILVLNLLVFVLIFTRIVFIM